MLTENQKKEKQIKTLLCCCCGQYTKGRQWWNRDTGYGLCPKCGNWIAEKESPQDMLSYYGERGIYWDCNPILKEA